MCLNLLPIRNLVEPQYYSSRSSIFGNWDRIAEKELQKCRKAYPTKRFVFLMVGN